MKSLKLQTNGSYWLLTNLKTGEEKVAFYYLNPDFHMNPKVPIIKGKDYSEWGYGFNISDGGGFLPEFDIKKGVTKLTPLRLVIVE